MNRSAAKTLRLLQGITDAQANGRSTVEGSAHSFRSVERCLEIVEESLSANERLAVYEKVADDETAARQLRVLLAHRANVLRILARLSTEEPTGGFDDDEGMREKNGALSGDTAEALLFSPVRLSGNLRERANQACSKLLRRGVEQRRIFPRA
jgi:hypothetical protein